MKLHWCCGDVYLDGYENIDIDGVIVSEGSNNPNVTTIGNYYKYPFGSPPRPFFVDRILNIMEPWPFEEGCIEEVVMISCIEHFDRQTQIPRLFSEVYRVLQSGGRYVVDFPDLKATIEKYYEKDPEFAMRLIYCNHKNEYSIHHWGYTPSTMANALREFGLWTLIHEQLVVKHDYPISGVVAIK